MFEGLEALPGRYNYGACLGNKSRASLNGRMGDD